VTSTPTGTVAVTVTGTIKESGSCTLSWSGSSASCSASIDTNTVGTYTITGTYGGDAVHIGSAGSTMVLVSIG